MFEIGYTQRYYMHHWADIDQHGIVEVFQSSFKSVSLVYHAMTQYHVVQSTIEEFHGSLKCSRDTCGVSHIQLKYAEILFVSLTKNTRIRLISHKKCNFLWVLVSAE